MIHKKMASILRECEAISKNRTNNHQGFKFRGIDDAMNTLHDTFANNSVFLLHEVLEHSVTERTTNKGGISFHHLVKVRFHFFADDGSSVSAIGIGEAADTGDKGAGKAMAYALKVCLLQTFLIPTEEDKDPDAHCHNFQQNSPAKKPTPITDAVQKTFESAGLKAEVILAPKFDRDNLESVNAVKAALAKAKIPNELIKKEKANFEKFLLEAKFVDFDDAVWQYFQDKGMKQ